MSSVASLIGERCASRLRRREVLAGIATASAAAAMSTELVAARPIPSQSMGLIDVHHHILPPQAPEGMQRMLAGWSAAGTVERMDKAGIRAGMAYPGPILGGSDTERAAKARLWNDFGASVGRDHPGRFGLFASLPLPNVEGCLVEIDHALDQLHADGFGIATSYGERWLGDDAFAPVWAKLNDRDAVVFVHPHDAACCTTDKLTYNRPGMDGSWIEWPMNTARAIMSLMVSGTTRRYPRIRFIFAHGGGVMPLLVRRVGGLKAWTQVGEEGLRRLFPDGVEAEFRRLHFECAQACSPTNMNALRSLVPDTNILFGSDYPFFSLDYAVQQFAQAPVPATARPLIAHGNAARLLPRWA